jgi:hypothetical protein
MVQIHFRVTRHPGLWPPSPHISFWLLPYLFPRPLPLSVLQPVCACQTSPLTLPLLAMESPRLRCASERLKQKLKTAPVHSRNGNIMHPERRKPQSLQRTHLLAWRQPLQPLSRPMAMHRPLVNPEQARGVGLSLSHRVNGAAGEFSLF